VVYVREVEDSTAGTLTLIVSGKLWRNSLVMQDRETGTLWSHITGEGLDGPLAGTWLEVIPSVQTTWGEWIRQHPDSRVLKKEEAVRSSRYERYFRDPERMGMFRVEWLRDRLPGKALVYGIRRGPFTLAVAEEVMIADPVLNTEIGEDPLVVYRSEDGGVRAYLARTDSLDLRFEKGKSDSTANDLATGSTWNLTQGRAMAGDLAGRTLEEVKVLPIFWFAWSNFYPGTAVIAPD
jgi:hypothetical protein